MIKIQESLMSDAEREGIRLSYRNEAIELQELICRNLSLPEQRRKQNSLN